MAAVPSGTARAMGKRPAGTWNSEPAFKYVAHPLQEAEKGTLAGRTGTA